MPQGYTLEQLKKMQEKPQKKGFTFEELQAIQKPEETPISRGKMVQPPGMEAISAITSPVRGFGKAVAESTLSGAELAQRAGEFVGGKIARGFGLEPAKTGFEAPLKSEQFKRKGIGEKIGGGVETILEFYTPLKGAKTSIAGTKAFEEAQKAGRAKTVEYAENQIKNTYEKALNLTAKQKALQTKYNKNVPDFLVKEGVVLKAGKGNRLNASEAIEDLTIKSRAENKAFQSLLKSENKYVSLTELAGTAKRNITAKGTDKLKAFKHIDDEIAAYKTQFPTINGDMIHISDLNTIKKDLWSKTKGFGTLEDKFLSDANFRFGHAAKDLIERNVDDINVKGMNQRLGDFANAIQTLEKRNGMPLPGGRLGSYFARMLGGMAGAKGGVAGVVTGAVTAEQLANIMRNPRFTTSVTRNFLNKLQKTKEGQTIIRQAQDILKKRTREQAGRARLPASQTVTTPPPATQSIQRGVESEMSKRASQILGR